MILSVLFFGILKTVLTVILFPMVVSGIISVNSMNFVNPSHSVASTIRKEVNVMRYRRRMTRRRRPMRSRRRGTVRRGRGTRALRIGYRM